MEKTINYSGVIEVDDKDAQICGRECQFDEFGFCDIYRVVLLPVEKNRYKRCNQCLAATNDLPEEKD